MSLPSPAQGLVRNAFGHAFPVALSATSRSALRGARIFWSNGSLILVLDQDILFPCNYKKYSTTPDPQESNYCIFSSLRHPLVPVYVSCKLFDPVWHQQALHHQWKHATYLQEAG